ncbi:unnamed protein product [Prunus armeniaca]|uniref:Uncharacterized protein n=1 Tax=Prunus armeniaca TaxID=36596 RepID=A0A6J5UNL7_PRUAR|nr:unnamed protein product [Prunus armeniaca]
MDKENELGVSLKKNLEKCRGILSEPGFVSDYIDRFIQNLKELCKLQHLNLHPYLITFCPITVPHVEGLHEGIEFASKVPTALIHLFCVALDQNRKKIQAILKASFHDHKINMIFYYFVHWVPEFTRKLRVGIKSIYYITTTAAVHAFSIVPTINYNPSLTVLWKPFGLGGLILYQRFTNAITESDAFCIRTCREIEGHFYDYLSAQHKKPMILIGLVYGLEDSNKNSPPLEDMWANWLGGFEEAGSVMFCAFESQLIFEKDQFQELVLGFELTGLPFFVVLEPLAAYATIEEAVPDGFEERVKGRGVVFRGWVQQTTILSYPLVGCLIMNTMILVKELKVAMEVEREENGWFSKDSLSKTITTMMDKENELGFSLKKNLVKWRGILSKPGFMSDYIDRFIQNLKELYKLQHFNLHPDLMTFCPITVPHVEGLHEGIEFDSEVPTTLIHLFCVDVDQNRKQIQAILRASFHDQKIDMIFYYFVHWVPEFTRKLRVGIKSICYITTAAAVHAFSVMDKENELGVSLKKNLVKWRGILSEPRFMSDYIDRFIQSLKELCKAVN